MQKKYFSNTSFILNSAGHHEMQNWQPQGGTVRMLRSMGTMLVPP